MKRILLLMLIVSLYITAHCGKLNTFYYTYEGQTLKYEVLDIYGGNTCEVADYQQHIKGDLILPAHPKWGDKEYTLTGIGLRAFKSSHELTSIVIPNTVEYIWDEAFAYTAIKTCKLPPSITKIPNGLFEGCIYLTSIEIPNGVTRIGSNAFEDCSSLTNVKLPNSLKEMGWSVFKKCSNLTSVELPYSLNTIPNRVFLGSSISSISIPNSVSIIEEGAFLQCANLKSVIIPNSVVTIETDAFWDCNALQSVTIPGSVKKIGYGAFDMCDLDTINIGYGLKDIGVHAFTLGEEKLKKSFTINITAPTPPECYSEAGYHVFPINFSYPVYVNLQDSEDISVKNSYESFLGFRWPYHYDSIYGSLIEATSLIGDNSQPIKGNPGQTFQLGVQVLPQNVSLPMIFWESTNHAVATVDNSGKVTLTMPEDAKYFSGEINGDCKIIASTMYRNGPTLEFNVKSEIIGVSEIVLNKTEWIGFTNEQIQLEAKILPANSSYRNVLWWSSDDRIASVDSNGLVTSNGPGECFIKVRSTDGSNIEASCKVVVRSPLVESIILNPDNCEVNDKESFKIKATVLPDYAITKELTWSSSDVTIATVDTDGVVATLRPGNVLISANSTDGSNVQASCKVTVNAVSVDSIFLNPDMWEGMPGDKFEIKPTIYPENASDKTLVWTSSNTWVAEVDQYGHVNALRTGDAIISAESKDGSGVVGECHVKVNPIPVESIKLSYETWTGVVGDVFRINTYIFPENAYDREVEWRSSDEAIAQVNEAGVVVTLSPGEADITATAADGSGVSATCHVTVLPVLVESIVLTPDSWSGEEGMTFQIEASVLPDNATDKKLKWTSSDKAIAIVDEDGLVAVLKEGTCLISATATDGSGIYAECIITSSAGIDEIFNDGETSWNVYDINGVLLKKNCDKDALKLLSSGIYILQSGNKIIKIVIR